MRRKTPEERQVIRQARGEKFRDPPLFSETAIDGKCPQCQGTQFRRAPVSLTNGLGILDIRKLVACVTCGKRFTRG